MSAIENISSVLDGTIDIMGKWASNEKLNAKLDLSSIAGNITDAFDPIKSAVAKVPSMIAS